MKHHIYEPCWSRRQELGVDGGRIKSAQLSHRYQGFTSCLWLGSDNKRTKERKRYSPFSEMVPTLTPIRYTLVKFRETFWFQFYVNTSLCEILMKFLYVEWRKWTICAHIQEFPGTAVMLWDGDHKYLIDILTPTRNDTFALRIQNSQVNA